MKLEWSVAVLADLDRFAAFLHERDPRLAQLVVAEILARARLIERHPQFGGQSKGAMNTAKCRFGF